MCVKYSITVTLPQKLTGGLETKGISVSLPLRKENLVGDRLYEKICPLILTRNVSNIKLLGINIFENVEHVKLHFPGFSMKNRIMSQIKNRLSHRTIGVLWGIESFLRVSIHKMSAVATAKLLFPVCFLDQHETKLGSK